MSRMDLSKLVEPVLRPAKISTAPVHTVVLDAGHGGYEQGVQHVGERERLRARRRGACAGSIDKSWVQRSVDSVGGCIVRLEDRAAFANRQSNAVFVSVHFNAGAREDAGGVETYSLAPRGVPSDEQREREFDGFPALRR